MENGPIDPAISTMPRIALLSSGRGLVPSFDTKMKSPALAASTTPCASPRRDLADQRLDRGGRGPRRRDFASAERRAADIDGAAEERGKAAATAAAAAETARLQEAHAEADREVAAKAQRLAELGAEEKRVANEIAALKKRLG